MEVRKIDRAACLLIAWDARDPAPPAVFVTSADANSVNLSAYCWVLNGDWLGARSDLWLATVERLKNDHKVALALPGQSVQIEQTTPA